MNTSIDRASSAPDVDNSSIPRLQRVRTISTLIQVVAVSLGFEMLLGFPESLGLIPRLSILALILFCIVLRLGWLTLVALQASLFFQEPENQSLQQAPSGLLFVVVAILSIVAAMNLPIMHRWVTDYILERLRFGSSRDSKSVFRLDIVTIAARCLQFGLVAILPCFLLAQFPIGRQSSTWLKWSLDNGQAVWPGTLMMVVVFGVFVLVRENAWRQLLPSQASLYLRSIQLIAFYRDLMVFERFRLKQLNKNVAVDLKSKSNLIKRPKQIRQKSESNEPDSKGLS